MKVRVTDEFFGGGRQGEMDISYSELVAVLGWPRSNGDGYKVDAEWTLKFADGAFATIYNYKTGPNYNGGVGTVEEIRDWHIGGRGSYAAILVKQIFEGGVHEVSGQNFLAKN